MCRCNKKHTKNLGKCAASVEAIGWPIMTNAGTEMIHGPHGAAPAWPSRRDRKGLWVVALLVRPKQFGLVKKKKIGEACEYIYSFSKAK